MNKTIFSILISVGFLFPSAAATIPTSLNVKHPKLAEHQVVKANPFEEGFLSLTTSVAPAKTPKADVNVSFSIADQSNYILSLVLVKDDSSDALVYVADGDNLGDAQLSAGSYTFLFWGSMDDEPGYNCILSDEHKKIEADFEYTIDFSKCTELVQFNATLPDGSLAQQPLENWDTDEIIEKGNLDMGLWTTFLFLDKTLIDYWSGWMDRAVWDGILWDGESAGNVLINPECTQVSLVQYRQLVGNKEQPGIYCTSINAIPARSGNFTNNPDKYASLDFDFALRNAAKADLEPIPVLFRSIFYNGRFVGANSTWMADGSWTYPDKMWIGDNSLCETELGLDLYQVPAVIGMIGYGFSNYSDNSLGILSYPVTNRDGIIYYEAAPNTFDSPSTLVAYNHYRTSELGINFWDTNEYLSYNLQQKQIRDGNSVPILVAQQLWYPAGSPED